MNWRDQYEVRVKWAMRPELHGLDCEVLEYSQDSPTAFREPHPVRVVRWAHGKPAKVAWCASLGSYVFLPADLSRKSRKVNGHQVSGHSARTGKVY